MTQPDTGGGGGGGYQRNWLRYLLIYLVVGGIIYLLVWLIFLRDGGLYG